MSRYDRRGKGFNDVELYKDLLDERGVRKIEQYRTPTFRQFEKGGLQCYTYIWTSGDAMWKLAQRFYGDVKYWYIIARYNHKPTDSHISLGDEIKIPVSLAAALQVVE